MKLKWILKAMMCSFLLILLTACKAGGANNASSSSSQTSSSTISSTTEQVIQPASMNLDGIMQGDYDSLIGTWQNSQGERLVFNLKGLVSDTSSLHGRGKIVDGVLETGVVSNNGTDNNTLLLVPKGLAIPQGYFSEGSDTSDQGQDRLVLVQGTLTGEVEAYYRQSVSAASGLDPLKNAETGVQLESGPLTIDYANQILGENGWKVIEGNYTRTEAIPYNVIEGDNSSYYSIYQNGVIVNDSYQIIYQP